MTVQKTRRESLSILGAVGWTALSGCGETSQAGRGGTAGTAGVNEAGSDGGGTDRGLAGGDGASGDGATMGGAGSGHAGQGAGGEGVAGEGLAGDGAGGVASTQCPPKVETVIGPYPTLGPLERKDVRGNTSGDTTPKPGAPLTLRVRVVDREALCAPIEGAIVEIWQCDAVGTYAGYAAFNTVGQDFCRGAQRTDAQGVAELLTIFPGSYTGRAVHIHFSIRKDSGALPINGLGRNLADVFVAQLYFEDAVTAQIFDEYPIYLQGAAMTQNLSDAIFYSGGADLLVDATPTLTGYLGEVTVGVRRSEIGL